jgi:hypothetical protein
MRWSPDWEDLPATPRSDDPRYAAWIKEHYPTSESALAKCASATTAMVAAFPELRRVAGLLCHGDYVEDLEHFWCVTPAGEIVDPTRHQYNQMMLMGYYEIKPTDPIFGKSQKKCMDCGHYFYEPGVDGLCSERCRVAFFAYLNAPARD